MSSMAEEISLASASLASLAASQEQPTLLPSIDYSSQNVAVLSVLLALAMLANLAAFPVILFRRTRSTLGTMCQLLACLFVCSCHWFVCWF